MHADTRKKKLADLWALAAPRGGSPKPKLVRERSAAALARLDSMEPGPQALALASELAVCLHALATELEGEVAGDLAGRLLELEPWGDFGLLLFIDLVEQGILDPETAFEPALELAPAQRLKLIDLFLLTPTRICETFEKSALVQLAEDKESGPDAGLACLAWAAERLPSLSFAVAEALKTSSAGLALVTEINRHSATSEAARMARLAPALGDPSLSLELAGLLPDADPKDKEAVAWALIRLAQGPDPELVQKLAGLMREKPEEALWPALVLLGMGAPRLGRILGRAFINTPGLRKGLLGCLALFEPGEFDLFLAHLSKRQQKAASLLLFSELGRIDPHGLARMIDREARERLPREERAALSALAATIATARSSATPPTFPAEAEGDRFEYVGFEAEDLSTARLHGSLFRACSFSDCDFTEVDIAGTSFVNCSFERCDFSRTRFRGAKLTETVFNHCLFNQAEISGSELMACKLAHGCARDLRLSHSTLATTALACMELTGACLSQVRGAGIELSDSLLAEATITGGRLTNVQVSASLFRNVAVEGLETDSPELGALARQTLARRILEGAPSLPDTPLPKAAGPKGAEVALRVGCRWLARTTAARMAWPFLAGNAARIAWGLRRLTLRQRDFLAMLPFMLQADFFEKKTRLACPACAIEGYAPTMEALRAARNPFPKAAPAPAPKNPVSILGVYCIGSFGSVAQVSDSDIDVWVVAAKGSLKGGKKAALDAKLAAMTAFARNDFDLDVHFFLMDEERVRANDFGQSGSQSSGSAQSLMLKEEFYRTAVRLAGRMPAWWLTPPGAGKEPYHQALEELAPGLDEGALLDLGHMEPIPGAEFFGAALWQIVKAMHSPFKSVLKFGLLQKYTREGQDGDGLLCESIKQALRLGSRNLIQTDPYVVLFLEIAEHYAGRGDLRTLELIIVCFFLKADAMRPDGNGPTAIPATREEASLRRLMSTHVKPDLPSFREMVEVDETDPRWLIDTAKRINSFMLSTYAAVRDASRSREAAIDPLDLTMLGRRIFAAFAAKEHKIERLPFIRTGDRLFTRLELSRSLAGRKSLYEVCGSRLNPDTLRLDTISLKNHADPAWLAAWLAANRLYHDAVEVRAELNASPITSRDMAELVAALAGFFPPDATFEPDIAENLKEERLVRAFFVLNLAVARESERLEHVSVVYSTNWGEMFCVSRRVGESSPAADPVRFLGEVIDLELGERPVLEYYMPGRARCPGLFLP